MNRWLVPDHDNRPRSLEDAGGTKGDVFESCSAYRPVSLTGEGLTLVDGVNYNAAGAMTAFTRRESGSVTVTNNYTFNTLYQMTNQTVARNGTPIQNLSYVFPTTNNNGQITQQTDHLSGVSTLT